MVAATQQQQLPPPQAAATTAAATSAEEEALKRNTDCVYFLASPLTCKKGSECEYRHSEYARVNPRDCYYWLNGNCLNPKCGFRHPPLDGLFGTQAAPITASALPPSHTVVTPAAQTPYNSGKQPVPCIFFQKGLCLKGDRCAFLHGPNPTVTKIFQPTVPPVTTNPLPAKKSSFAGLQKCTREQKISHGNFSKVAEATSETKYVAKPEIARPRNGVGVDRNVLPPNNMEDEVLRYKSTIPPPVVNGNTSRSNRLHQSQVVDDHGFQNGKDVDDLLRESSPGFDVLVDDELRDSDYYHGDDNYDGPRGHEGRNLNSMDNYDMVHSADYSSMADIDRDAYRDPQSYDAYGRMQGYALEQQRILSERMVMGSAHLERRDYLKADSPEQVDGSDLRYRLSKQRRVNGLRSVVNHDFVPDNHIEEQGYLVPSQSHQLPSNESSISNRLRGRIKLLGRSPNSGSDMHAEREMERGRNRSRVSPGRPQLPHQGRLRDRIKGRVEEEYNNEGRNFRGPLTRREIIGDRDNEFAGPKSLAELKVVKNSEGRIHQALGKRKPVDDNQSETNLSFEGPLPLSEILKRKRVAEGTASGGVILSVNKDDNNQKESNEGSNSPAIADKQSVLSIKGETNSQVAKDKPESNSGTTEADGTAVENNELDGGQSSVQMNLNDLGTETEDGMIGDDGMEYHEYEGDDQRDGDYEYEQDEGDYNYEEGENAEVEEEYVDDEDGDDFAKKIGVMFS